MPATSGRCTRSCPRSRRIPTCWPPTTRRRRSPIGAYRSDAPVPMAAPQVRELVAEAFAAEVGSSHAGPRDRRRRVHRSLGRRRAPRAGPHGPPDRQPGRGRRGQPRGVRRSPGFLPFEVGDVRDAASCRRWTAGVDAVAHLAASISVQDSIDDPGDDLRERRGRHVQPARGRQGSRAPGSCS